MPDRRVRLGCRCGRSGPHPGCAWWRSVGAALHGGRLRLFGVDAGRACTTSPPVRTTTSGTPVRTGPWPRWRGPSTVGRRRQVRGCRGRGSRTAGRPPEGGGAGPLPSVGREAPARTPDTRLGVARRDRDTSPSTVWTWPVSRTGTAPWLCACTGFPIRWPTTGSGCRCSRGGYRVVAPYMRGSGPSAAPASPVTLADLVAAGNGLHEVLGGDERAVVVGHDWGRSRPGGRRCTAPTVGRGSTAWTCRRSRSWAGR